MDGCVTEELSWMKGHKRVEELLRDKDVFFRETFCEIFHRTAQIYPDKTAVVDQKGAFTYRELDEYSNDLALRLVHEERIQAEEVVALQTGRSIQTLLGIIAIWKAGGASLYIDRCVPPEELNRFREDSGFRVLIDKDYLSKKQLKPRKAFFNQSKMNQLATLVYTSGSTSMPKGVMIEHRNISAAVSNFHLFEMTEEDVFCMFANLNFVAALHDLICTLSVGGTVDIIPEYKRRDIRQIIDHWRQQRITVTFLPPHMAKKLMKEDDSRIPLRMLFVGSEPVRDLMKKPYRIMNIYAASEMCSVISIYEVKEKADNYPIGHIVPTLHGYIVDEHGKPVEPGKEGELWLSGPQVTRGYLHRPELTARQYIENPFMGEDGNPRLFKTNDIVVLQPDGNLRYICRKDNMYKIRGFRVEGSAVESAIRQFDYIDEVSVVAFKDSGGEYILCGYFSSGEKVDVKKLKKDLKQIIPYYMVPTALIQLDALPRNRNNKVDRKALVPPKELDDHKLLEQLY